MTARIAISVKPGSKRPGIELSADAFVLRVRERALEGAANAACVEALARYLDLAPSRITLVRGAQSRHKLFEVEGIALETVRERLTAYAGRGL